MENDDAVYKVCKVTNDLMILVDWDFLMLYNISNKTLISTLKCGDKILSIKKDKFQLLYCKRKENTFASNSH